MTSGDKCCFAGLSILFFVLSNYSRALGVQLELCEQDQDYGQYMGVVYNDNQQITKLVLYRDPNLKLC